MNRIVEAGAWVAHAVLLLWMKAEFGWHAWGIAVGISFSCLVAGSISTWRGAMRRLNELRPTSRGSSGEPA